MAFQERTYTRNNYNRLGADWSAEVKEAGSPGSAFELLYFRNSLLLMVMVLHDIPHGIMHGGMPYAGR